jgi:nucleoside-diphosphate-sugar epimerase
MRTVLVLGAAGRVGEAAAKAFVAKGWKVRGGARGPRLAGLAEGIEPVAIDAFDRNSLIEAARDADVIVNALNPLYTEWREKVLPMAENVIAAAQAVGATHMLPGNIYNFGHEIGMGMKEGTAQTPSTEKARIRIAMEELFRERAEQAGVRTVVIRAGDFYGGKRPGTWLHEVVLKRLHRGVFVWPGPTDMPHSFAYLPDLGRAFAAVAERAEGLAPFEVFHFEGHTMTGADMKRHVEAAVGRELKLRGVPWPLLKTAGLLVPLLREIAAMSYLWRMPHSLDGARLRALLPDFEASAPGQAVASAVADLLERNASAATKGTVGKAA